MEKKQSSVDRIHLNTHVMSDKKQSSVEWLINEIDMQFPHIDIRWKERMIEQAKQMEKEQNIGLLIWMNEISKSEPMRLETDFDDIVEQYYNETFGK